MKEDREMLTGNCTKLYSFLAISTILIGSLYIKNVYHKFMKPLNTLQDITNKLNLNTLDNKFNTSSQFIEF